MKKGLDRVTLKYIAAAAMLLDHIGMLFLPIATLPGCLCRIIGRLTFPIMCFFLSEGCAHTSNRRAYALRLLLFAVISQFPYTLAHHKTLLTTALFTDWNVIFTFFISFLALWTFEEQQNAIVRYLSIGLLTGVSALGDWGLFAPLLALCFSACRGSRNRQAAAFSILAAFIAISSAAFNIMNARHWYGELWQLGLFLFLPLLYLYNGARGSGKAAHKWFFYVFYPLHLLILGLISLSR